MADTVANELDKLHGAVADKPTVLASLEELFHGICARMKQAIRMGMAAGASDAHLAHFEDLMYGLEYRGPDLAAAVMANTPHVEPTADAVPEGVSTADDKPLPGHAAEPPWDERVKEPILPTMIADGGASVESTLKPAENAAQAHDAHEAQAEANVAAHADDHDAKKKPTDRDAKKKP
jgi:hypothetical protein